MLSSTGQLTGNCTGRHGLASNDGTPAMRGFCCGVLIEGMGYLEHYGHKTLVQVAIVTYIA